MKAETFSSNKKESNQKLYYMLKCSCYTLLITDFCSYWKFGDVVHVFGESANLIYCNPNEQAGNVLYDTYNHSFFGKYKRTVTQNFTKQSSWENKDKDLITYIDNFDEQVDTNPYEYGVSIGNYVEIYYKNTGEYVPDGKGTSYTALTSFVEATIGDIIMEYGFQN